MKILIFLIVFYPLFLFAHQPKLINYSPSAENPYKIKNPEISKAFYGTLDGVPHIYEIKSENDFLFYAGILTPKTNDDYLIVSFKVFNENKDVIYFANGKTYEWFEWYEPYARDLYWKGPEIGTDVEDIFKTSFPIKAGTYYIEVFNEKNTGSYSLAVGEEEYFGSNFFERVVTWTPIILYISPYMDIIHWNKFDIRAFIPHIVIIVVFSIIYLTIKRIFKKKIKHS